METINLENMTSLLQQEDTLVEEHVIESNDFDANAEAIPSSEYVIKEESFTYASDSGVNIHIFFTFT